MDFILEVESIEDQNTDKHTELELLFIHKVHTIVAVEPLQLAQPPGDLHEADARPREAVSISEIASNYNERSLDDSFDKDNQTGLIEAPPSHLLVPNLKHLKNKSGSPILFRVSSNESVLTGGSSNPKTPLQAVKQQKRTAVPGSGLGVKTALFEIDEMQLEEDHSYSVMSKPSSLMQLSPKKESSPPVEDEQTFPPKLNISSSEELSISQEGADFVAISEKVQRK